MENTPQDPEGIDDIQSETTPQRRPANPTPEMMRKDRFQKIILDNEE